MTHIDLRKLLPERQLVSSWIHHTGALGVGLLVRRRLLRRLETAYFDLVWVDSGHLANPRLLTDLRDRAAKLICYNVDDPFGSRDGLRFRQYRRCVPYYDLLVVVREVNIREAQQSGSRAVMHVYRSADEVAHAARELSVGDRDRWASEVVFVGTWMPERGPFLARLIELGVPLSIHGNRWQRAKEWSTLQPHWKGPGISDAGEYAKAVQAAKVCLGLLSRENRDLSTTRSFEIPYLGGVFSAERTPEHQALYKEDEEAVFWSSPEECAAKCKRLLEDDLWRESLRRQGRARCVRNGTVNEPTMDRILRTALRGRE